jgi:hypothetical protein
MFVRNVLANEEASATRRDESLSSHMRREAIHTVVAQQSYQAASDFGFVAGKPENTALAPPPAVAVGGAGCFSSN